MDSLMSSFSRKGNMFEVHTKTVSWSLNELSYGDLFYLTEANEIGAESIFMYLGMNKEGQPITVYYLCRLMGLDTHMYQPGNKCYIGKDTKVVRVKFKEVKASKIIFEEV